jgi:hypothetical protein
MMKLIYADAAVHVRDGLESIHQATWQHIASPGRWWDGKQRLSIAQEVRNAQTCKFCKERKNALSFASIKGTHIGSGELPNGAIEAIHRTVTDPARLTEKWLQEYVLQDISEDQYVELLGVVSNVVALDIFSDGVGAVPYSLPDPQPGTSSSQRPSGAKLNLAWVSTVAPEDAVGDEKDMYPGGWKAPNIRRAMSLVPEESAKFFELCDEHYIPTKWIWDMDKQIRAITNTQIELVASRVSMLNGCFY